jgi:hypothetical protein
MRPPYNDCSPNLRSILGFCTSQSWGGKSLGCHNDRAVVGGSSMSSHAWGAALDYQPDGGNSVGRFQVAPYLIFWSAELGINTIHDYVRQQMWKPMQGWVSASIGSNGGQWIHIETTPAAWGDGRSVAERTSGQPVPPPPPTPPAPPPSLEADVALWARFIGENEDVAFDATGYRYITPTQRDQLRWVHLLRDNQPGYPHLLPVEWKNQYPRLG